VFDTDTGKQLGKVKVVDGKQIEAFAVARLDDTTAGVVWRAVDSTSWKLAWVKVPPNKAPSVTSTRSIAVCAP
jgi:hypothetical protein